MTRALVTGGTGFIGHHLVSALMRRGYRVTLASRAQPENLDRRSTEWIPFDLGSPEDLGINALGGVDCVFHLAAQVHLMNPSPAERERFFALNALATETLARKAAAAGVRRFVFLSSIKVNGERTRERPFRQGDEPAPVDAYGLSKWHAEKGLNAIAQRTGLEVVIVRPPLVYGPGVGANFRRLLALASKGWPLPFSSIRNRRSLVSVANLVDCLIELACYPTVSERAWLVCDNEAVSTPELFTLIASQMNRPARMWPLPAHVLRFAGQVAHRVNEVSRLLDSLEVDATETWEKLNWRPAISLRQGISQTVEWYESLGGRHV